MIRRSFFLPALLEAVDLIIDIAGAAFLSLALFAVGEDCSAFFSSNLIPVLNFLWRLGVIAALIEDFD
jgi:hypothetical protein